jgi:hypothetical protein
VTESLIGFGAMTMALRSRNPPEVRCMRTSSAIVIAGRAE